MLNTGFDYARPYLADSVLAGSVLDMVRTAAQAHGADIAVRCGDREISYADLMAAAEANAVMLRERGAKRIDELKQLAKEAGYEVTLTKIGEMDGRGRRGRGAAGKKERGDRRAEVSAKYQNPDNAEDKWSGRGRQPKWVQAALGHGRKLEDLAISAHHGREA